MILSLVIVALLIAAGFAIRHVPPGCNAVVHRRGSFDRVLEPGWHLLVPGIERISQRVEMGGRAVNIRCGGFKSHDNQPIDVSGVVFFQVLEADKAIDYVDALDDAAADLARRTASDFVRELEASTLVTRTRQDVNTWLLGLLNQSSSQWGVRVTRIELDFKITAESE